MRGAERSVAWPLSVGGCENYGQHYVEADACQGNQTRSKRQPFPHPA